jgi:hypothetical protein
LAWISTAPWQLGKFVCYDLDKVLSLQPKTNGEIYDSTRTITPDTFLKIPAYQEYVKFSKYRFPFASRAGLNPDSVVAWNPRSYHSYMLAGDHYLGLRDWSRAASAYSEGLKHEVATVQEREYMQSQLAVCHQKLK